LGAELLAAAEGGVVKVITELLSAGADVDYAAQRPGYPDTVIDTALSTAALFGNHEAMQALLAGGAAIDMHNGLALFTAAHMRDIPCVRALLAARASPNLVPFSSNKLTPLMAAMNRKPFVTTNTALDVDSMSLVRILCEGGADINFKNEEGLTPMAMTIFSGNFAGLRYLHECGAKLDFKLMVTMLNDVRQFSPDSTEMEDPEDWAEKHRFYFSPETCAGRLKIWEYLSEFFKEPWLVKKESWLVVHEQHPSSQWAMRRLCKGLGLGVPWLGFEHARVWGRGFEPPISLMIPDDVKLLMIDDCIEGDEL